MLDKIQKYNLYYFFKKINNYVYVKITAITTQTSNYSESLQNPIYKNQYWKIIYIYKHNKQCTLDVVKKTSKG